MSLFSSNEEHFCTPFALHNHPDSRRSQLEISQLEPENEYGNVEYKLHLADPTPERIERLVTQLKWRIREGHGEAILFLGVKDNGIFVGLTPEEVALSLKTLEIMSSKIGASVTVVKEKNLEQDPSADDSSCDSIAFTRSRSTRNKSCVDRRHKENTTRRDPCSEAGASNHRHINGNRNEYRSRKLAQKQKRTTIRKVIQVLVKRKTYDINDELRVAVLGPTESGKSSLLGVLSHGEFDNGRGSARLNLFRHRHEIRSGHTSSISQEVFGLTDHGIPLTYSSCLTTEEIIESSSRVVTLIDLAGHQRYLGTTLFGLGSHSPDLVLVVVSAMSPVTSVTIDHISLAIGMGKAFAIVMNKTDLATKQDQENCYNKLIQTLHAVHPVVRPLQIQSINDAILAGSKFGDGKLVPIFATSCVKGSGINLLYAFFNELSPRANFPDLNDAIEQPPELHVDETFEVPGIGTVVSGLMVEGIIREGDDMLLGPDDLGNFSEASIVSLQRHKIPCNFARAGQKCTLAISTKSFQVRKGMVMKEMVSDWRNTFSVCWQFEAEIKFINNAQLRLGRGSQVSVFVGNVKQTCSILDIRPTQKETIFIDLKLTKRPEYIRQGSCIIIRHALTKGIGAISRVKRMFDDM